MTTSAMDQYSNVSRAEVVVLPQPGVLKTIRSRIEIMVLRLRFVFADTVIVSGKVGSGKTQLLRKFLGANSIQSLQATLLEKGVAQIDDIDLTGPRIAIDEAQGLSQEAFEQVARSTAEQGKKLILCQQVGDDVAKKYAAIMRKASIKRRLLVVKVLSPREIY